MPIKERTSPQAKDNSSNDPAEVFIRLYISPLTADSLPRIIGLENKKLITDTSFHTLETFPEKPYGYLTLPESLGESIRKKYHGNIFKGVKMKVEEARPERKKRKTGSEAEAEDFKAQEKGERRSKRKRGNKGEEGVLKGIELPDGRKVKRGWSDSVDEKNHRRGEKKDRNAKKSEGESQLVFRTSVPPTSAPDVTNGAESSRSKVKKSKRAAKGGNITEVREHEKTTKFPTFVRTNSKGEDKSPATEYVDGKGWIDAKGNVVEAAASSTSKRRTRGAAAHSPLPAPPQESSGSASSSEVSSPSASSDDESTSAVGSADEDIPTYQKESTPNISITSPDISADQPQPSKEPSALEALFKRPNPSTSSSKNKPEPISTRSTSSNNSTLQAPFTFFPNTSAPTSDPDSTNTNASTLSKRKPASLQINPIPSTPFTRRDLDARSLRSAAPTPDTAAIGRRFRLPVGNTASGAGGAIREREGSRDTPDSVGSLGRSSLGAEVVMSAEREGTGEAEVKLEDDEGDQEEDDDDMDDQDVDADMTGPSVVVSEPTEGAIDGEGANEASDAKPEAKEQNEFEKHFYEHRGEYNRAWKANKREARKGARQAENRKGLRGKG